FSMTLTPPTSTLFPYTTLFRSDGTVNVAADWYVDVTVANGKTGKSSTKNMYRTDAVTAICKPITVTKATLTLASGKVELTLRLTDRKSTRLNSSHRTISYAVFC